MKLKPSEQKFFEEVSEREDESRFATRGGYPSQLSFEIPGYVVVATVNHDDAPLLIVYSVTELKQHIKAARKYMKEHPEDGISDAWFETQD